MKFTKEEISLCKQVAEKHRKEIIFGVWFHDLEDPEHLPFLWCNLTDELKRKSAVPLWTISDCLEFLEERGWDAYDMSSWGGDASMKIVHIKPGETSKQFGFRSTTLLKACLKAVLAVLEEK